SKCKSRAGFVRTGRIPSAAIVREYLIRIIQLSRDGQCAREHHRRSHLMQLRHGDRSREIPARHADIPIAVRIVYEPSALACCIEILYAVRALVSKRQKTGIADARNGVDAARALAADDRH